MLTVKSVLRNIVAKYSIVAFSESHAKQEFMITVKGKKFRNPKTGNQVGYSSLPPGMQKKIHDAWRKKYDKEVNSRGDSQVKKHIGTAPWKHLNNAPDRHAARALYDDIHDYVYDDSQARTHKQLRGIRQNLRLKMHKGIYDHSKAHKAFRYLVDEHTKGRGIGDTSKEREHVAKEMAHDFYQDHKHLLKKKS